MCLVRLLVCWWQPPLSRLPKCIPTSQDGTTPGIQRWQPLPVCLPARCSSLSWFMLSGDLPCCCMLMWRKPPEVSTAVADSLAWWSSNLSPPLLVVVSKREKWENGWFKAINEGIRWGRVDKSGGVSIVKEHVMPLFESWRAAWVSQQCGAFL
jgi:hypothetical protein